MKISNTYLELRRESPIHDVAAVVTAMKISHTQLEQRAARGSTDRSARYNHEDIEYPVGTTSTSCGPLLSGCYNHEDIKYTVET